MTHSQLRELKQLYETIHVPDYKIQHNWELLQHRLPEQGGISYRKFVVPALLFASILLFILIGTVGVAQASRPGDTLYPVKVLSDNVVAKVTGNYHQPIEKRTDDIINESKHSPKRTEKATEEYKKTIDDTKQDVKGAKTEEKAFEQTLNNQETKLKQTHPSNPEAEQHINQAITETEKVKQEVQQDTSHQNNGNNSDHEKQNNHNNQSQNPHDSSETKEH